MIDTQIVNICQMLHNVWERNKNDFIANSITTRDIFAANTGCVFTNYIFVISGMENVS